MKEIKAESGYLYTDRNKEYFYKAILVNDNDSESNYIKITQEEADGIVKERDAISKLDTLEAVDEVSYTASVIPMVMNVIPMTNNEALERKTLFPMWSANSVSVKQGEKYQHENKLYEVVQDHVTQENWSPSNQSSLWMEVVEDHDGTLEDPIPYNMEFNPSWQGMIIYANKYYIQGEVTYKCIRDSVNKLTNNLDTLVGTYVETV